MKRKNANATGLIIIIALVGVIAYLVTRPRDVQQMGVLLGENDETLPLYGKEVRGRRDQYHYYTSTPGQQIYSIPITHDGRDCMDDLGCRELYGNESVNVLGKAASYEAKLYRTDHFF